MESRQIETLLRLGDPGFRSFSEAADAGLHALSAAVPGVIVLGEIEPTGAGCRVIDVHGDGLNGVERGSVLPLASSVPGTRSRDESERGRSPGGEILDLDHLRALGAQGFIEVPLELSEGRIAGVLAALDPSADAYGIEHTALLGVTARLLSREWENVELRAELRRLRRRAAAGTDVDVETGLPNRIGFLKQLDHEWRLAERGTVESVLVTFGIDTGAGRAGNGNAVGRLALKVVAEVLEGSVRRTDRVGRVGPATLAAVLVGCRLDQAPTFVGRFQAALRRVTEGRDSQIELSLGVQALAGSPSVEEVLALAEAAAEGSEEDRAPATEGSLSG